MSFLCIASCYLSPLSPSSLSLTAQHRNPLMGSVGGAGRGRPSKTVEIPRQQVPRLRSFTPESSGSSGQTGTRPVHECSSGIQHWYWQSGTGPDATRAHKALCKQLCPLPGPFPEKAPLQMLLWLYQCPYCPASVHCLPDRCSLEK